MEYMEQKLGKGWWGSDAYATYYEDMGSQDDPFSYIKVIPLIGAEAQKKCGGFDHAGKWETSLMLGTYPELVDLGRCAKNTEWFAKAQWKPAWKRASIWWNAPWNGSGRPLFDSNLFHIISVK